MTSRWESLYLRADGAAAVAEWLIVALTNEGYQRFDPFPGGTGTPVGIKETVRLFAAPPDDGFVRVIGALPENFTLPTTYLHLWLTTDDSGIVAYRDGIPDPAAAAHYLKVGKTLADLTAAQQRPALGVVANTSTASNLPSELAQFAQTQGVNPQQADKLFSRIAGQLFGKMDRQNSGEAGAMKEQAKALITQSAAAVDWNSPSARTLTALVEALALPKNWREPDFDTLRESYQVARRVAHNPKAMLLPDEKQALAKVPDAIGYQAIYMGK